MGFNYHSSLLFHISDIVVAILYYVNYLWGRPFIKVQLTNSKQKPATRFFRYKYTVFMLTTYVTGEISMD